MSYIFLDESGDLGFDFSKKKTSRFFVITCVFVKEKDKKPIEKAIKKTISQLSKKEIKVFKGVLHFHKESPKVKNKFLNNLSKEDFKAYSIIIDKRKIFSSFIKYKKHFLYLQITKILLEKINDENINFLKIFISRRETSGCLNNKFCNDIQNYFFKKYKQELSIFICLPHAEKCLQIADSISWTIFSKLERNDDSYFKIIGSKVKLEKIKEKYFLHKKEKPLCAI